MRESTFGVFCGTLVDQRCPWDREKVLMREHLPRRRNGGWVEGLGWGFKDYGLGSRVQGFGFWVLGLGFRIWGLGFRVQGSGFGVYCLRLGVEA